MEQKIPQELFCKLEQQRLIHRISKDFGFKMKYKPGRSLALVYDEKEILDLAGDTIAFWTSDQAGKADNVCILENKEVVWKFHNDFARKVVHLFENNLKPENLGNAEVKLNQTVKKNVSRVEICCSYDNFKRVFPKIETICKGVETLYSEQVKIKQNEKIKARKFVEDKLDSDKSILCLYHEKEKRLDIFSKNKETIAKTKIEFSQGPLKMTRTTSAVDSASKTSVHKATNSFTEISGSNVTELMKIKSLTTTKELQDLASRSVGDRNEAALTESAKSKVSNDLQLPDSEDISLNSATQSSKGFSQSTISGVASAIPYATGVDVGIGANFRYEFDLLELKVLVYKYSIVEVRGIDAIVNAANEHMAHGGGVAYYISKAAGKTMDDEGRAYVAKNGKVRVGENCVTGAGKLPCKGIIHAVGPQWADYIGREDQCARDLYRTIINVLKRAKDSEWKNIALCAISAGIYGVPKQLCAEMYLKALVDFDMHGPSTLREVHFVDISLDILECIKAVHQTFCRSPDCLDFRNAFKYPSASAGRLLNSTYSQVSSYPKDAQRSVYQKGTERITSQIQFLKQSKTNFDNSPLYEFKVCGTVKVLIYTGNLVRVANVDAIVCSVNDRFIGVLANEVSNAAGPAYQRDLQSGRRTRTRQCDGDVLITGGGALRVGKVLHVMIVQPIDSVNKENLSRLRLLNQRILEEAHINRIRRLAMPLIGAGRLRGQKDIESCCRHFAEVLIQFCSKDQANLHIEEIHIVNQDITRSRQMVDILKQLELQAPRRELAKATESIRELSEGYTTLSNRNFDDKTLTRVPKESTKNRNTDWETITDKNLKCTYYESCKADADCVLKCGHAYCEGCAVPFKTGGKCYKCNVPETKDKLVTRKTTADKEDKDETCPVCLCDFTDPEDLPCGHRLCRICLTQLKQHKPSCPVCNKAFGVITGTQPEGEMTHRVIDEKLPGYLQCNTIQIFYDFPDGTQGSEHPRPGKPYKGTQRPAYLPNNREGRTVLKLLKVAFSRRLIFTIGDSRTTGKGDRVTWNDVHHKTAIHGGPEKFGYPDPDYLSRVKDELASKGVTEESLK